MHPTVFGEALDILEGPIEVECPRNRRAVRHRIVVGIEDPGVDPGSGHLVCGKLGVRGLELDVLGQPGYDVVGTQPDLGTDRGLVALRIDHPR